MLNKLRKKLSSREGLLRFGGESNPINSAIEVNNNNNSNSNSKDYQTVPTKEEAPTIVTIPTVYTFQVEYVRFIAYLSFWGMCIFAAIMCKLTVSPNLGPCPATEGAEPTYGLHCSVLMETFGFNNICVTWDYSPSRELTAMVYPIFEYLLLAYIILDYLQIKNDFDNDKVSTNIYNSSRILLWVKIVLVAWFRMIFVCSVVGDPIPIFGLELQPVVAHTLGFFGMQFALILIAFQNVVYIYYRKKSVGGMSVETTKIMSIVYLVSLTVLTLLKVSWASSIFIYGTPWIGGMWPHLFDRLWMLLAAILPLFFAFQGMKTERPMSVSFVNDEVGES